MLNVPFERRPSYISGGTGDKKEKIKEVPER